MNYIGIDIGGTAVKIGWLTEKGEILSRRQDSVSFDHYRTPILDTVLKAVDSFLGESALELKDLSGIGISATGQIDPVSGAVSGTCGNLPGWTGAPLKQAFQERYGLPVTVINDANCAALAEQWIGRARGLSEVVVLTVGTGIGGGIITNGKILLGSHGLAGEIGHMSIDWQGRPCTCQNRGCLEQYASMTALVRAVTQYDQKYGPHCLTGHEIDGKEIFRLAEDGHPIVRHLIRQWIHHIACGIAGLVHIFNPAAVLIGGGVSTQKELFIDPLRSEVLSMTMENFKKDLVIDSAQAGNDAGIIGAVWYLIRSGEQALRAGQETTGPVSVRL